MNENSTLPVIGVFTKQLDNWQSGSGHHLNEIMHRILDMNEAHPRFKFVFIHYAKSDNPIYQRVEELIIPRNPLAATLTLRKHRFDILHYTPLTIFAPIWGIRGRKVATIHGAEQLIVPQFYGTLEMLHERFLVPIYARKMDHILTVSHTSRGFFMGRYRVPGDRITVCPNAVSSLYRVLPDRRHPNSQAPATTGMSFSPIDQKKGGQPDPSQAPEVLHVHAVLKRFGLSPGEPYIFHLSQFSERKNPWMILEGFRRFLELPAPSDRTMTGQNPVSSEPSGVDVVPEAESLPGEYYEAGRDPSSAAFPGGSLFPESSDIPVAPPSAFKLVIGGTRWDNPRVDQFLEQSGIANRVIRTGFLKEEEAVAFYNYAAAFLFPSLAEGFGMPNLEAMACGCPVITSNVFAIPEVVGDAAIVLTDPLDAGALVEAIRQVVYDPALRERLIERGFQRVKQFDWEESARNVMRVYEGLSGRKIGN